MAIFCQRNSIFINLLQLVLIISSEDAVVSRTTRMLPRYMVWLRLKGGFLQVSESCSEYPPNTRKEECCPNNECGPVHVPDVFARDW